MKIYIEEKLPKSCEECRFLVHCYECEGYGNYCTMLGERSTSWPVSNRHERCPLEKKEKRPQGGWRFDGAEYEDGKVTAIFVSNELHGLERARFVPERQHGEWGKWIISEVRCPECLEYFDTDCYAEGELDKCPSCGAVIRPKEGEPD